MTQQWLDNISDNTPITGPKSPLFERQLSSYLAGFMTENRRDLLQRLLLERTRHLTVVVEDMCHAHNGSACLRSCDCFGIQDFHVIENRFRFDVARDIARGATQWLTMHRHESSDSQPDGTTACIERLKSQGYQIVTTSPHDADCDLETYDISKPTALLFGNEKDGASQTARNLSDHVMRVPMHGFTESFNISVAVAVCLHHLVWRMRQLDFDWRLSSAKREELLHEWVRISTGHRLPSLTRRFQESWSPDRATPPHELWPDWDQLLGSTR